MLMVTLVSSFTYKQLLKIAFTLKIDIKIEPLH